MTRRASRRRASTEPLERRVFMDSTVVFNEVMYHPTDAAENLEWVEVHNQMAYDMDLTGWSITGGVDYNFPANRLIPAGGYLVVALNPAALQQATGYSGALGPFTGRLANGGEAVRLRNNSGRVMDEIDYGDAGDWPAAADGGGVTLAKTNRLAASAPAENWGFSGQINGTPGAANAQPATAPPKLALNEVGAPGTGFFVEIINHGTASLPLAGTVIRNSAGTGSEFVVGPTTLAAGARMSFSAAQLGFNAADADKIFLYTSGKARLLDAVAMKPAARGRFGPEGTGPWRYVTSTTPGAANAVSLNNSVVINEIMYHPRPLASSPGTFQDTHLFPIDTTWKYHQAGQDLGFDWRQRTYNDTAWQTGTGLFYVEEAPLPGPKNTPLTLGANTYYFRKSFNFTGTATHLTLGHVIDDGAVFYLNGREIYRFNMAEGAVGYSTPANPGVGDAAFAGPFSVPIPAGTFVSGTNVLAVEVHQGTPGSTDVVFGVDVSTRRQLTPPTPFRESNLSWVELYNRGTSTVDLSGWKLDDAVDYTFPAGTTLTANSYLVVAENATAFSAEYPGVRVLGNFGGGLSNSSDLVRLVDARKNPADEVRYFDDGRWHGYADGGGSSLELRDPRADNSKAEAWAASDESGKSAWRTYTYRGIASPNTGPDGRWQEFVLGLLDRGEVLLDDLRVTDVASGGQLLQNGNFSGGDANAWRIIGNHSATVVNDPTNAANKVLRLLATGPTEHMHNHAETTFAGGQSIQNGREYEISFRAKWLAGSNQFHTRLYFNRLARTTLLATPPRAGTPGARNSKFVANAGPTYANFAHAPAAPQPGQAVTVSVDAADPNGVSSVAIKWRVDGAATWNTAAMTAAGGKYTGTIPGHGAGTLVRFYVEGRDAAGATSTFPAAGPNARAMYKVADGSGNPLPDLQHVQILMTAGDVAVMHQETNVMSDQFLGATVVYTDANGGPPVVYYDARVHLRSSERGRHDASRVGFNVQFDPQHKFRGVHDSISLDRAGGYVSGAKQDEIVIKHVIQHAGDVPGMYDDLAYVSAPRSQNDGTALLQMARYGGDYLDGQYQNGSDGTVHKLELIYFPLTTDTGGPEGLKRPQPDDVIGVDIQDLGPGKETYRWHYVIQSNRDEDAYAGIIRMAQAFSQSGAALDSATQAAIDVDSWLRTFAIHNLVGDLDSYGTGYQHNLQFYTRPEDGKVLPLPWDWDFGFGRGTTSDLFGGANISRILTLPTNLHAYYSHLEEITETTFNGSYMSRWTSHYGALLGQNMGGIQNYITERSNFVRSQLPANVPFQITTNGGANFSTDQATTLITGDGWVDVRNIFISGRPEPLNVTWTDQDSWQAVVPLVRGSNALTFQARDYAGRAVGSDSITVNSTVTTPTVAANLRITELHYHPTDPPAGSIYNDDDFEFIEVQNIGTQPLPVGGAQFTVGVDFIFSDVTLAPGQHALIVENLEAFQSRYGTAGFTILGQYTGNLDNAGEPVRLEGPAAETVHAFTFGDDDWYVPPDGFGPSLVIRDPRGALANWNVASGWRPSTFNGGSPGAADPTAGTPATVAGRRVFYNNSAFDGNNAAANASDDAAIAADKRALLPGQTATFANYTSFTRGLNGLMVDIANLPAGLTPVAGDFGFRSGNDNNPAGWATLTTQPSVGVRRGAGTNGSARLTLTWPDGVIKGKWLQVTVKATANTGLPAADVFYFGNAIGESGNSAADAKVTPADELGARANPRGTADPAPVDFKWDYNRDKLVNPADQLAARDNQTTAFTALKLIAPGGAGLRLDVGDGAVVAPALSLVPARSASRAADALFAAGDEE